MQISTRSHRNMATAYSWDVWPLDPGPGVMLVLFRYGRSTVAHGHGRHGPAIFPTEADAAAFVMKNAPALPRRRRVPENQKPATKTFSRIG